MCETRTGRPVRRSDVFGSAFYEVMKPLLRLTFGFEVVCETPKSPRHRHPGGVHCLHTEAMRNLAGAPLELDARHDHLAIFLTKLGQRISIPLIRFRADGCLERRCAVGWLIFRQLDHLRPPSDAAHLVADVIDHRLPKVRLHRADVAGLERVQPPEHMKHGFLDQVAGVQVAAGGRGQPAVRPSFQGRKTSLEQRFDGSPVSGPSLQDELDGGLIAQK